VPDPHLAELVHGGAAVTVATRDEELRPAITRGWGPDLSADGRTLTLCVIAPPGSATRANLESAGPIAIALSPPSIARAAQLKGTVVAAGEPGPAELERARRHTSLFIAEAEQIGLPGGLARSLNTAADYIGRLYDEAEFVAVTVVVDEVFDQTPGPTAGRRL
jgi:hypothetical protein